MSPQRLIHDPRNDIPVVSPGLRRLVFGTLWTVATIVVVAWRISDGLPVADGIVAGTLMATWPWAVIWLADRTDLEDLR